MKFVKGKRQFLEERVFGFVLVSVAGVKTFALIIGRQCWGFQWTAKKKPLASAKSVASLRASKKSTGTKSSEPSADSGPTKTDSPT